MPSSDTASAKKRPRRLTVATWLLWPVDQVHCRPRRAAKCPDTARTGHKGAIPPSVIAPANHSPARGFPKVAPCVRAGATVRIRRSPLSQPSHGRSTDASEAFKAPAVPCRMGEPALRVLTSSPRSSNWAPTASRPPPRPRYRATWMLRRSARCSAARRSPCASRRSPRNLPALSPGRELGTPDQTAPRRSASSRAWPHQTGTTKGGRSSPAALQARRTNQPETGQNRAVEGESSRLCTDAARTTAPQRPCPLSRGSPGAGGPDPGRGVRGRLSQAQKSRHGAGTSTVEPRTR